MRMTKPLIFACLLLGVAGSFIATTLEHRAVASRNSSGTYSLPSGNPVVTGTTISSTWANGTLSDIGTELTNSLDRGGRGAMTAPLRLSSGSVSAPSLAFSADTNSGLYRAASHDVRMSINGTDSQTWTTTGTTVAGTSTLTGLVTALAGITVTDNVVPDGANANGGSTTHSLRFGLQNSAEAIGSKRTAGGNQNGLDFYTNAVQRMSINMDGGVQIPGSNAPAPGTPVRAVYGATYSQGTGTILANNCSVITNQTLTGAYVGGVCRVSPEVDLGASWFDCHVVAPNTVAVRYCSMVASGSPATYTVHVVVTEF